MPLAKGTSSGSRSPADASRRPAKKRITDEEWLSHKEPIGRLYLDEGKDVRDVRDTMRREYGFEAHEKAYKRKFEEWGLTKNVPKDEGLFMVKKRERRREGGKETVFWRRRRVEGPLQLVPDDKVDRIADRYSHDLNSFPDSGASTPDNIEYGTPESTPTANTVPPLRPQQQVPTSSGPAWGFPGHTSHTLPVSGYATAGAQNHVVGIPAVLPAPPIIGHAPPHYYQQPASAAEETPNMIGHTHPSGSTWDPWSQQYF